MARTSETLPIAGLVLNADSNQPMYQQLYQYLRGAILEGRLRPGQRLPATRHLAKELGVSRNTVMLAFDDLFSEGYLKGKTGSGTFVTETLPDQMLYAQGNDRRSGEDGEFEHCFSQRGQVIADIPINCINGPDDIIPFQHGVPGIFEFPYDIWSRLANRRLRNYHAMDLGYSSAAGYPPLREAIADYLRTFRALRCEADQIVIVNGTQQSLNLLSRLLLDPGDSAWVEDPGYIGTYRAMIGAGVNIVPIPIDEDGLDVAYGKTLKSKAKLVYVTPSHQYPLGVTMSVCRRIELLEWANENNAWIIEDDYDSEYRYCGRPLSSLQGLDIHGRVIYLGTFSKVLFPSLRLGYMVVPRDMATGFIAAKTVIDRQNPTFEQAVLTDFITEGHFGRHIRRMRMLYQERQEILIDAVRQHLDGRISVNPADAGMHMVGWLPEGANDRAIAARLRAAGVLVTSLSDYTLKQKMRPGLVMGYTAYNKKQICAAVKKMAAIL